MANKQGKFTKGDWKVTGAVPTLENTLTIYCEGRRIAIVMTGKDMEANANLIVAAVNACIKFNPSNPIAVAESIDDMYEALKKIVKEGTHAMTVAKSPESIKDNYNIDLVDGYARQALAKADRNRGK